MFELEIIKLDNFGRGIGFIDNKITFVKNALIGELVLCKLIKETKKYNIAKVVEYKKYSKDRVEAFCPFYQICGGCNLEHLSYEDTLKYKKEKIESILNKEHILVNDIEVIENVRSKNYRNKLSLKIKNGCIGFYEENSHNLIEIDNCPIANESINECLKYLKFLNILNGDITIRCNYNNEILLIVDTLDEVKFNYDDFNNLKIVGVVVNKKTIYGNNFFYERMNGFLFKVSFDAFFQINPYITTKLFDLLEENIDEVNTVIDLYSGVGTLGIVASKRAKKVYSIEIVKNAVLDNILNKKLNKKDNIFPMLGDAKEVLPKVSDEFDKIIVDPPRKGLDKNSCNLILNSKSQKIIYISCDPMTLVRDLKELTREYEIKKFYILDMFSYTYHVECVCVMSRR